jgi:hypothetical protein
MAARTNPRDGVEKDGDGSDEEEDSKPSSMTSSRALIASCPDQEVVQEEATRYKIPSGWKRIKLEPDC